MLIIYTKPNEIELSLWDLNYYVALKELKCAIYDGLEMKLKVTKMFRTIIFPLWCDDDGEWSI